MSVFQTVERQRPLGRSRRAEFVRHVFSPLALLFAGSAVMGACVLSWVVWQHMPFAQPSSVGLHLRFGLVAALLVVAFSMLRDEHRATFYLAGENNPAKTIHVWNLAMAILFVTAFLTRRAEDLSRGAIVLFYFSGFTALWFARAMTTRTARLATRLGVVVGQRLLVVGTDDGIAQFLDRHKPWRLGFEVVGTVSVASASLNAPASSAGGLRRAADLARQLSIDDVYVAVPWSDMETIDACLEAFLTTPVAIHLAPERVLDRFDQIAITRVGALASLELTRPMSPAAIVAKRIVDLGGAILGLVILSPLLLLVAILIKLDSRGPALFLQTRYGFNQRPFRIVKFRTMTTFHDGADVLQATAGDARVTRLGRILRRTNIDELPQLLNVLAGQMSLVGPRPHAVPHNRAFERRIALYARRHNVRPGITGWAQVNGLRGETDTDEKLRSRVDHDLYYIDNWSMLFDLRILFRTVFSAKAYSNAY